MIGPRNPPPRFGTPRNPARKTLGPAVGKVMAALGNPPMPWQQDFLAVACEINPETGLYWYSKVILIVPRQAGKTSTSRGKVVHRGLTTKNGRMLYTAQDRNKALKRLDENFHIPLMESPLARFMRKPRFQAGSERLNFVSGSRLSIDAISKKTGHGDTLHEAHIDEAYAHVDNRIEGGIGPTMGTVPGAQRWVTSAAGNQESLYLIGQREMGRALVTSGVGSKTLYWEFSAPEDADPDDPETALGAHPAIGHTFELDWIMNELTTDPDPDEVRRAYLGWWPTAKAPEPVIPTVSWEACFVEGNPGAEHWYGEPLWWVDVSPDRDWASVGIAARSLDPSARCFVELVKRGQGTDWVVERLSHYRSKYGGSTVVLDGAGGAKSLAPDLEDAEFEVLQMPGADKAAACTGLYDDVLAQRVRIAPNPELDDARKAAAKLRTGGGETWVFSRGKSMKDITALYGTVVGRWGWIETRESDYDPRDSVA